MELKELKKEIDGLTNINDSLKDFKSSWVRQIKKNTNPEYAFLLELDDRTKKKINIHLANYQQVFNQLKYAQFTNEKLASLAQYLVELKVTSFNDDNFKPKVLLKKFMNDDFLNINLLVDEVKQFEFNLNCLRQIYDSTNRLVLKNLSLEHSVTFIDASHKEHLVRLEITSEKQQKLLKILGKEFVKLVKKMKRRKRL